MSLRLRLIGLVAIALVVSLLLGVAIACFNASRSVGTEMESALLLGRRAVENAGAAIRSSRDPRGDVERLIALFKDNRHLRVSLAGDPAAIAPPAIEHSPFGKVPAWFVRLIGVPSVAVNVPITVAGQPLATVVLETDPHNETLDVWNDFNNTLIVLVLFCVLTISLIYLFIGRALQPLYRFAGALERVGQGDYATQIGESLTPEVARLHQAFNRMAGELAAADADNRRLNEQVLTVQEQERAEIARDLHDEVGPYLFAINIDVANAARLAKEGRAASVPEHLRLVSEAVEHMQHELRSIVRRLQPVGLAEFGLPDAVDHMIQFWRRRRPEVDFRVAIAADCEALGEVADTTIYRIVQECLSNSLRHGRPTVIAVDVRRTSEIGSDRVVLEIRDDGLGMSDVPGAGFGLRGMTERVRAIGGRLTLGERGGGGLTVTAVLPHRLERGLGAVQPERAAP